MRVAKADFCGVQSGFGLMADTLLYNLREVVGLHPVGSTVSAQTILRYGFALPLATNTTSAGQTGLPALVTISQAARGAAESHDLVLGGATPPPAPIFAEVCA